MYQECCKQWGWRGLSPPPFFDRTVNPISTRGQILPTTVLQAPTFQTFKPSDSPVYLFLFNHFLEARADLGEKNWRKEKLSLVFSDLWIHRDCCSKYATGLKCLNRHRSKSIWVISLFFCQNDSLIRKFLATVSSLGDELLRSSPVNMIITKLLAWNRGRQ
jgi:hypothetical protein